MARERGEGGEAGIRRAAEGEMIVEGEGCTAKDIIQNRSEVMVGRADWAVRQ